MKNLTTKRGLRCAIYTRVSTDQGLEQDFNSLDAQREASEAYIKATSNIKARGLFRLIHHKRAPCAERTGFPFGVEHCVVVRRGARDVRVTQPPLRLQPIRGSSR